MSARVLFALCAVGLLNSCGEPPVTEPLAFRPGVDGSFAATIDPLRMDARFDADGARFADVGGGALTLRTVAWGRDASSARFVGALGSDGPRLTYADAGITEWWEVRPSGFEQGWTLDAPPAGDGPVVVTVRVDGAEVTPWITGAGADLVAADGSTWTYAGVAAWDVTGAPLSAIIEGEGDEIRVVVDDTDARWPIMIDPVLTTAASTILGASSGRLGCALDGGDVNGDGYDDLVVGAYSYSTRGIVYVYHGSATGLSATPSTTLTGSTSGQEFGWDVKTGDFNNDGYADVAASQTAYNNGTVYVFHGSSSGVRTTASTTFGGTTWNEHLGQALAVGDVNGDGYDDLVATSFRDLAGSADVHLGGSSGVDATVSVALSGGGGQRYGYAADGLGDINGDGYEDLGVSHYEAGSYYGKAWIYTGGAAGPSNSRVTEITGGTYDVYYGRAIGGLGDVNGDGYDDVGVGAVGYDIPYADAGAMFVYYGAAAGVSTTAGTTLYGARYDEKFGWAIDTVGDLENDGYDEILVGTYNGSGTVYASGGAYVIAGSAAGPVRTRDTELEGTVSYEHFGVEVAGLGDVNGDGYEDIAVGEPEHTGTSSFSGAAYVYYGYDGAAVDADGDGYSTVTDCDDADATVSPGASETCDGEDDDCDGTIDDGVSTTYYADADADGWGSPTSTTQACALPAGHVTTGTDCDDTSALAHPGGIEIVGDGIDEDCDGAETCRADADRDGYGTTSTVASADADCSDSGEAVTTTDCDDAAGAVHPGATEVWGDGTDQDCDDAETCYADSDGDSFGGSAPVASADLDCADAGEAPVGSDCDDADATVYPAGSEVIGDGIDSDCSGGDVCWYDRDGDHYGTTTTVVSGDLDCTDAGEAAVGGDCDDLAASVSPGAGEIVADGVDQDCDGGDACFVDADGDGHGEATTLAGASLACDGSGEAAVGNDCDDAVAAVYPGAAEVPANGIDEDCDTHDTCWLDGDRDGQGGASLITSAAAACDGRAESTVGTDCDDAEAAIFVGAEEDAADGVDADCDGLELCWVDADGDGFGTSDTATSSALDCVAAGVAARDGDCDDTSADVSPTGAEEPADGVDGDCDGTEICQVDADGDGHGSAETDVSEAIDCDADGVALLDDDCDDDDDTIHPDADEEVADRVDQDCDGGDTCYADSDGDGYGSDETVESDNLWCDDDGEAESSDDCDDSASSSFPGAAETCNRADDNCDGSADEGIDDCDGERRRGLCGCATPGGASSPMAAAAGLLLLAVRRRR